MAAILFLVLDDIRLYIWLNIIKKISNLESKLLKNIYTK